MIDMQTDAKCKACNKPVVRVPGRRPREFCNDACRQKHYRQHHMENREQTTLEQQNLQAALEKLSSARVCIEKLERQVQVQRTRIGELTEENRTLRTFIDQVRDIETAFSTDTGVHPLKRFLAVSPHHAVQPGCVKILDPEYGFPPAGSRGTYADAMRRAGFTAEQQSEVWDVWRSMLRDELFTSYYAKRNDGNSKE